MDAPKRSPRYQQAILEAFLVTEMLTPAILAHRKLAPEQGENLLRVSWNVYLYAIAECDLHEAKETYAFMKLVETYLRLDGYTVGFSTDRGYCVYQPKGE